MTKMPNMMFDRPPMPDEDLCAFCGHVERQHWWGTTPENGYATPCSGVRFLKTPRGDEDAIQCLCTSFTCPELPQARLI